MTFRSFELREENECCYRFYCSLSACCCLIKGGDWFVEGASALAQAVPSAGAAHRRDGGVHRHHPAGGDGLYHVGGVSGHGEIAYGNAIGSVICNAALIAAITIAVRPGPVDPKTLRTPVAFFFAAAAIYCVAAYGFGKFTRPMGLVMLALFVAYMAANVAQTPKRAPAPVETAEAEMTMAKTLVLLVAGAVLIAVGADLLVDNGTRIAQELGVPESVIALTFVALGTSLPELGDGHHLPRQGLQRPLAGQHRGGQRLQSGAGQRHVRDHRALHHPPELHPVWGELQPGAGPARDAGRHGPDAPARFAAGNSPGHRAWGCCASMRPSAPSSLRCDAIKSQTKTSCREALRQDVLQSLEKNQPLYRSHRAAASSWAGVRLNTASMRSVRKVALPVPWARRFASATSPATPIAAAAAAGGRQGFAGHRPAEGPHQGREHAAAARDAGHGGAAVAEQIGGFAVGQHVDGAGTRPRRPQL